MKKLISLLLGIIFFLTLSEAGFWIFSLVRDHYPLEVSLKNNKSLLIIGNSYTVGPLVSPNEIYSKKVENQIGQLYNVINISDYSLNTALIKEKLKSLVKLNPKIVFLMIGQPNHWNLYGYNNFLKTSIKNSTQVSLLSTLSQHSRTFAFLSYSFYQIKNSHTQKNNALTDQSLTQLFLNKISNGEGKLKINYRSLVSFKEIAAFFDFSKTSLTKKPGNIGLRQKRIILAANLNYPLKFLIEDINQLTCYGNCYNEIAEIALQYYLNLQKNHQHNYDLINLDFLNINSNKSIILERRNLGIYSEKETPLQSNSMSSNQNLLTKDKTSEVKWLNYLLTQTNILKSSLSTQKLLNLRNSIELANTLTNTVKGFDPNEDFLKNKECMVELFSNHLEFIDRPRLYLIGANALFEMGENDLACLTLYNALEEYSFNSIYSFKELLSSKYQLCSKKMQQTIDEKMITLKKNGIFEDFTPFSAPSYKNIQSWRYYDIAIIVKFFNSIGAKVVLQTYLPRRFDNEDRGENKIIRRIATIFNVDLIDHFNEILKLYPDIKERDKIYLQGRLKGTTDDHFSPEGHQLVADAILKYLRTNNYIK